jgi:hypothetical protein
MGSVGTIGDAVHVDFYLPPIGLQAVAGEPRAWDTTAESSIRTEQISR